MIKKIVQIWFGVIPEENIRYISSVKKIAEDTNIPYVLITGNSYGSPIDNAIASNELRLEIAKVVKNCLYVDCDIILNRLPFLGNGLAAFSFEGSYPSESLFYSGSCEYFQNIDIVSKTIGGLRKAVKWKWIHHPKINIIEDHYFTHGQLTRKKYLY